MILNQIREKLWYLCQNDIANEKNMILDLKL